MWSLFSQIMHTLSLGVRQDSVLCFLNTEDMQNYDATHFLIFFFLSMEKY